MDSDPIESQPTTPGKVIERALAERGWTHDDLAAAMKKHRPLVSSLIAGTRSVTAEVAVLLAGALGKTPSYWLSLEANRQLSLIPGHDEDVVRRAKMIDLAPIKEMERRGWIKPTADGVGLEDELKRFFGVETLDVEPSVVAAARKANPDTPLDRQERAWVARARQLATAHPPAAAFNRDRLPELISKLRHLAAYPRECSDVCEMLRRYGIRFVVVEPLEKCRIDGAAFWVDGAPAIAMSLRIGRIDSFWFTLMHEVAHIYHNDVASVDSDLAGKGQIPSRLKPEAERRADETAADWLIPTTEIQGFIRMFSPLYSKTRIIQFAHRVKIHPGIIVGQLQNRAELGWDAGRSMLVDVREYVTSSALTDGWGKIISPGTLE